MYKVGKIVFCFGTFIAKANYLYQDTIPERFRPKYNTSITSQNINYKGGIATATINIFSDGSIKTLYSYENLTCICASVWEVN